MVGCKNGPNFSPLPISMHFACNLAVPSHHCWDDLLLPHSVSVTVICFGQSFCSSVAKSCLTLCNFPVLHYLLEFAQTHFHCVRDTIQPLLSPLLLLPSIFPSIRVFSNKLALCIRWPKYWSFNFSTSPSQGWLKGCYHMWQRLKNGLGGNKIVSFLTSSL